MPPKKPPKKPPKNKTKPKKKEELCGQDLYIRSLLRGKSFPSVDDKGEVYFVPTGSVGWKSIQDRRYLTGEKGSGLTKHLNQHFP